jgi:hypothetical protein
LMIWLSREKLCRSEERTWGAMGVARDFAEDARQWLFVDVLIWPFVAASRRCERCEMEVEYAWWDAGMQLWASWGVETIADMPLQSSLMELIVLELVISIATDDCNSVAVESVIDSWFDDTRNRYKRARVCFVLEVEIPNRKCCVMLTLLRFDLT